jgi:hypothetical protein
MNGGVGEVTRRSARRPNPYVMLQRQVSGFGALENRLLIAAAVAGPLLFLGIGLLAGLHGALIGLLVLLPAPALGVALGLRGRRRWPAQDIVWWMSRRDATDWRRAVGGSAPRNAPGARAWLEADPEGSTPAWARAKVMLLAGRIPSARQTIAAMAVDTPTDRWRRLELELTADAYEGRPIDTTAVDASIREDPDRSPQEAALHLAYHEALVEVDGGRDGLPPLLAARASLGRLPPDLARRLWVARFRYAAISLFVGAWLLVAILVALATSGGVVWF